MAGNFDTINGKLSIGAGQSIRRNAGDSGFEAYTPSTYSLPSQTGNSGKFLGTNGTSESWGNIAASDVTSGVFATARLGTGTGSTSNFLRGDGAFSSNIGNGFNIGSVDGDATFCGLIIRTDRTYPLFIRNAAGSNLFYIDSSGGLTLAGGIAFTGNPVINVNSGEFRGAYFQDPSTAKGYFATNTSGINFDFSNRVAGNINAVFNAHASQTANIVEIRGLSSSVASFDKDAKLTIGTARFLGYTSSASTPTTTELPNNKDFAIHKDTGTSKIYLAYNDGGVIRKVELT